MKYKPGHGPFQHGSYRPNEKTWDVNLTNHFYDFLTEGECYFCDEVKVMVKLTYVHPKDVFNKPQRILKICKPCEAKSRENCFCGDCYTEWLRENRPRT